MEGAARHAMRLPLVEAAPLAPQAPEGRQLQARIGLDPQGGAGMGLELDLQGWGGCMAWSCTMRGGSKLSLASVGGAGNGLE